MKSASQWFGALAAILMLAGPAMAADAIFVGKVKSINAEKKSCVMTGLDKQDYTFALDAEVTINRDGKESKSDLKVGDMVQVCYDKGVITWTCHYIVVQEGAAKNWTLARVTFKSYDAAKKELVVTNTADSRDLAFALGDARVGLNGQSSKMDAMKIGDPAIVIVDRTANADPHLKAFLAWRK